MPGADGDKEADNAVDPGDDKLYCICKTSYDEDRVMIACDRYVRRLLCGPLF